MFLLFHYNLPLENGVAFQTWILFDQECFVPSLVEISPVVLEKKICLNFVYVFSLFRYHLPWKEARALHLNKFEYLIHQRMLWTKFGSNWPSGSVEEDLFKFCMNFCYFVIISPWKRVWYFICTNLNPLHQKMLCAKFGWNWPCGSGEEEENLKSLRQWQWTNCDQKKKYLHKLYENVPNMPVSSYNEVTSLCLFGVLHPTREFFTHMETSPLPVKDCKFWPKPGTHGHWAVRVL